jgi:transposase
MTRFPLTPADRRELLDHYRRPVEPETRLRAHILLLLDDGHSWTTIRAVLFCSLGTINRWKRRFEAEGVIGLAEIGVRKRWTRARLAVIKRLGGTNPFVAGGEG